MADISDVEQGLVNLIAQTLYPNGTGQPSALVVNSNSINCRVSRGWPNSAALDADLLAGVVNINVYAMNIERNVTRYNRAWVPLPFTDSAVTLTINAGAGTITLGGTLPSPYAQQNFAVSVNGNSLFTYTLQPTDTLTAVATALATSVAVHFPGTTSSGPVITVEGAAELSASVGVLTGQVRELKRQVRVMRIILFCPNPASRDAAGILLDPAIADVVFLTMPDGTGARVRAETAPAPEDATQKANMYRRDLVYGVEYSTSQTEQTSQITAVSATLTEPVSQVVTTIVST